MPRNAKVDAKTRTRAVVLVEEGYSYRDVGTRLGISYKTVFRLVKKHRETGSIVDKPRSGRPKATTEREDRILVRKSLGDRRLTSPELRAKMEDDHGVHVSSRTVRSRLFSAGLRGCVAAKKPLLRDPTIRKRLAFAREHRDWTIEQWNSVLWSDESSFQLFCGAKRAYVRRRVGEKYSPQCIVPTVKHGGRFPDDLGVHVRTRSRPGVQVWGHHATGPVHQSAQKPHAPLSTSALWSGASLLSSSKTMPLAIKRGGCVLSLSALV